MDKTGTNTKQKKKKPKKTAPKATKKLQPPKTQVVKKTPAQRLVAHSRWRKIILVTMVSLIAFTGQAYAIAYWYQKQHQNEPLTYGVTFIPNYARYLGLDPQETMLALRDDLGFKRFRLVSYWSDIEKTPGNYDFSELDWQFDHVAEVKGDVTLAVGLRQPRWPECHAPGWAADLPEEQWYPQLEKFMGVVVNRYKNRPELHSYQLENEFFLGTFGDCKKYGAKRARLISEFNYLKTTDPNHPIILSYANNYFGISTGQPQPDIVGVSVYKRIWEKTVTKAYFEYPFPSWYYSWRAGLQQIITGKPTMLHELQAEPWPPGGITDTSIQEQNKSMDSKRLKERISYGERTGFRDIDLWGGEWWYWRKTKFNDPSLWDTIKQEIPPENM